MFKWILITLAVIAGIVFFFVQRNAVKVTYVNGLAIYNHLPNQEYIFQRDCYIFKLDRWDSTYPLVGAHDTVPELPAEIAEDKVGQTINGARILGVARLGDRIRIVSVRREESRKRTFVTFEILFLDEVDRPYPRMDAYFILDHTPETDGRPPEIRSSYAVPRVKA